MYVYAKRSIEEERSAAMRVVRNVYVGTGKIEVLPKYLISGMHDIAAVFTPGVGYLVQEILQRPDALGELTGRDNTIAVVTDGTAVLGLGNVGPRPALPVMEAKASMFKLLVGIDAIPICLATGDGDELVAILKAMEPTFGGYNLEDVASPICFDVMSKAESGLMVPIIHDDQYGTATVVAAGLINSWKLLGRLARDQRVVVCGDGAAGTATVDLLRALGVGEITVVGLEGIWPHNHNYPDQHRRNVLGPTNNSGMRGALADAMRGADAFVGLSTAGIVTEEMVRSMATNPVVFAMANPVPEIMPAAASRGGAAIVATGRFDFPNQCNNVLAFPSLMRAALDTKAIRVSSECCIEAARAIAADVPEKELRPDNILPTPLSETLYPAVAEVTARAIVSCGLARMEPQPGMVAKRTSEYRAAVVYRLQQIKELVRSQA